MEYQKIINLLGEASEALPKFNNKKCVKVHDQSGG